MTGVPTIVVVDDAADVRALVRSRLRLSERFELVGEGASGFDAEDLARRLRPDVMLLDISMEGMDGLEALPRVRAVSPDTRVVMYSGFPEHGLADRCRALGAAAFFEKSPTFDTLVDDLLEVLATDESIDPGRETEEVLRLLIEAVEDYAIFMLDPAGRVVSWNPGAERSKGWKADEIVGQHFRVFYPAEKRAERHPEHKLEIALREGRYEEEGWRVRKDGTRFWAHVTITAVRDSRGELVGFGKVTRDDTERRETSFRLEEANERLLRAAEDQSQFLAMTAHEPRSPIGVLGGTAQLLRQHWTEELPEGERAELLGGMSTSAERLSRLLADLLTASRIHGMALALDIHEVQLAERLEEIVHAAARTGGTDAVRLGPVPPVSVWADPDRLAQMVENLVTNALRHGAAPVEIDVDDRGSSVDILVRDAGQGIPESIQARLFERFVTSDRGGTGLGLYIVRELARAQGGDATFRPEDRAFVISLPSDAGGG